MEDKNEFLFWFILGFYLTLDAPCRDGSAHFFLEKGQKRAYFGRERPGWTNYPTERLTAVESNKTKN